MSDLPFIHLQGIQHTYSEGGYNNRRVLDKLDLSIDKGECIALLGRSGSGKSTLLNLLGGIDLPDKGRISINGQPLNHLSEQDRTLFRRKHIGIVYQFFNLIPTLTVSENISLPLQLNGHTSDSIENRLTASLTEIQLTDRSNAYPDQLSGGEQQRVAIARALIHRPALVLADEPTGNLDAETGQLILDLLKSLSKQNQQTLLLVTHSLEVARQADRILTLEDGHISTDPGELAW